MNENSVQEPHSNDPPPTLRVMASCLQKTKNIGLNNATNTIRRVTFPDEDSKLITGYLEPANPWENADCTSPDELIALYKTSCEKHGTEPLEKVLAQIKEFDFDVARNECLNLKGELLSPKQLEPLEEIFKRIQFKTVDLEGTSLDDEAAVALFDMMEYYESGICLNISSNHDIGSRGWHACSRMIKRTQCLERLDARNITLTEQHMPILSRALRIGTQLQILNLENCGLAGRPAIIMAAALRLNTSIKELYLADNDLGTSDAIQLASVLRSNYTLQLLDVSNNNIQDGGVGHISDGLIDQAPPVGGGLSILIVWNNRLTRNASNHFARAVALSKTLGVLNMGHNVLTNECVYMMKDSLQQNRTLLRLGMQSTHLCCEGAIALAECIADHPTLQRIDLRDNNLQVAGLMALTHSMKVNCSVTQLDLDDMPKKPLENIEAEQYRHLVAEIRGYCARNEQTAQENLDTMEEDQTTPERRVRLKSINSRKISLTCETLLRSVAPVAESSGHLLTEPKRSGGRLRSPAPSPIPSPISSPLPSPSRTRFSVSKVAESPSTPPSLCSSPSRFFASPSSSRFHVSKVELDQHSSPTITSPGNNVTVGFAYDAPEGASSVSSLSVNRPTTSITNTTSIPEIIVKDASSNICPLPSVSPNISVTVRHGTVIENPSPDPIPKTDCVEDPDMEVTRIMDNTLRLSDESKAVISPALNQKSNSLFISEEKSTPVQTACDAKQGNGSIDAFKNEVVSSRQPATVSTSQRSRKISRVLSDPHTGDERPQTSLEKLIGLFHPNSFFNKTQQHTTALPITSQRTISNSCPSFLTAVDSIDVMVKANDSSTNSRLNLMKQGEVTEETDVNMDVKIPDRKSPSPDIINNNSGEMQIHADDGSAICLDEKLSGDVPNSLQAEPSCPRQDENFNVSEQPLADENNEEWCEETECVDLSAAQESSKIKPPNSPLATFNEPHPDPKDDESCPVPGEALTLPKMDLP